MEPSQAQAWIDFLFANIDKIGAILLSLVGIGFAVYYKVKAARAETVAVAAVEKADAAMDVGHSLMEAIETSPEAKRVVANNMPKLGSPLAQTMFGLGVDILSGRVKASLRPKKD